MFVGLTSLISEKMIPSSFIFSKVPGVDVGLKLFLIKYLLNK